MWRACLKLPNLVTRILATLLSWYRENRNFTWRYYSVRLPFPHTLLYAIPKFDLKSRQPPSLPILMSSMAISAGCRVDHDINRVRHPVRYAVLPFVTSLRHGESLDQTLFF